MEPRKLISRKKDEIEDYSERPKKGCTDSGKSLYSASSSSGTKKRGSAYKKVSFHFISFHI